MAMRRAGFTMVEDAPIVPVTWVCGFAEAPGKMTVKGENKTNVQASYLPFMCRARGIAKQQPGG